MDAQVDTDVLVVGGGPVGLTLAHELGSRGVRTVLVEPRTEPDASSPRCKQVNPRSMEQFRRLGLADDVRSASLLPFGWSDSLVFCTSLTGHQVARFDGVFSLSDTPRADLPEPAQWTAQFRVEDALRSALVRREPVTARWGSRLTALEQDDEGVVAEVVDGRARATRIRARYLAACDGGRSTVRRSLGVALGGTSHEVPNLQVVFDAPGLGELHPQGRAVQYWVLDPATSGLLGRLDTGDRWWAIIVGAPPDADGAWLQGALRTMIGADVPVHVRSQDPWTARMLLADRFRVGRCFLLGDAAHLNPPWGGFGANTGIGDAVDLGWKLAAVLQGWGGEGLLDSYEAERRPLAARVLAEAERNTAVLTPELSRPGLDGDGPAAQAAREAAAEAVRRAKTSEAYTVGFVLGAGCPDSPLVVPDERAAPVSSTSVYRPSAAPGMRLPHLWLGRGASLYDRLGHGFTLLELGAPPTGAAWRSAAARRGVPLEVVRLDRPDAAALFAARYLLVRPDQLVAWRGDEPPDDAGAVLDHVRGSRVPTAAPVPTPDPTPEPTPDPTPDPIGAR